MDARGCAMMIPGWIEMLILLILGMVILVIPLGIIAFLVIIYRKLHKIETRLKGRDTLP
jgi:hypothetical protein